MKIINAPIPSDDKQEMLLTATVVSHENFGDIAQFFQPAFIYNPKYRVILETAWQLWGKRATVSAQSIANELLAKDEYDKVGGLAGIEECLNTTLEAREAVGLAQEIHDQHLRREELKVAESMATNALDRGSKMANRLAAANNGLRAIEGLAAKDARSLTLEGQGAHYFDKLEERSKKQPDYIRFPFSPLAKKIPGIPGGILIGLLAEPGHGKTSLLDTLAERWTQKGKRGAFYHLEDSAIRKLDRRYARYSGIPIDILERAQEKEDYLTQQQWTTLFAVQKSIESWPGELVMTHCPDWTMNQIISHAQILHRAKPLDYVIIDYWQKIKFVSADGLNFTQVQERDLEMFKSFLEGGPDSPPLVGAIAGQFDKAARKDKYRNLDGLKGSSALSDKAQIGLIINRNRDELGNLLSNSVIDIAKANDWSTGPVEMKFVGARFLWTDDLAWNVDTGE